MSYLASLKTYRAFLKELLTPTEIYEAVEDINLESLSKKGIKTLLLDLDNTLMTYQQKKLSLKKLSWVEKVKSMGFQVLLISNNSSKPRVQAICEDLNVDGLYFALKPFPFSLYDLADKHYIDFDKTALIGDQLFTDIILGNWCKLHAILVDPMDKKVSFLRTMQREFELFLLTKLEVLG